MQVDFLNIVLDACHNVLVTMADLDVKRGKPELRKSSVPEVGSTVSGLICMRGDCRVASVGVIFTDSVLKNIALRMLPDSSQKNELLAFDLVGEISNMIIGGAKAMLLKEGYNFQITLPTVISGYDYLIAHQTHAPILRIPLKSEIGLFYLEASFEGPPLSEEEKRNKLQQTEPDDSGMELF